MQEDWLQPNKQTLCHSELVSEVKKQEIQSYEELCNETHFSFLPFANKFHNGKSKIFKTVKKALAFTLAETLIVMGIIGVVSALTIPNLNSSTADKEKVAKVKKVYSELLDAYGRVTAEYGPIEEWKGGNSNKAIRFLERMSDYMKISKYCGLTNPDECFMYNGGGKNKSMPTMITADGTSILYWGADSCYKIGGSDKSLLSTCGTILVDIDGKKGKNEESYDQFGFVVTQEEGIVPQGKETQNYNSASDCLHWKSYCTGWVIDYDNMDYLKAKNSQYKCPNGTILSATVTSCK